MISVTRVTQSNTALTYISVVPNKVGTTQFTVDYHLVHVFSGNMHQGKPEKGNTSFIDSTVGQKKINTRFVTCSVQ